MTNNNEYNSDFFIPKSLEHAKNIILTPENDTTDSRWNKETDWIIKTSDLFMNIDSNSFILDWGCGLGRISKSLIDKYQCRVMGIDIEQKMLEYATSYVDSDLFCTMNYEESFQNLNKFKFSHIFSCWVFQHSNKIQYEIPLLYSSMNFDSQLFVLELDKKAIPNKNGGYFDDGVSTSSILGMFYDIEVYGKIPTKFTTEKIKNMSWWGILKKRLEKRK